MIKKIMLWILVLTLFSSFVFADTQSDLWDDAINVLHFENATDEKEDTTTDNSNGYTNNGVYNKRINLSLNNDYFTIDNTYTNLSSDDTTAVCGWYNKTSFATGSMFWSAGGAYTFYGSADATGKIRCARGASGTTRASADLSSNVWYHICWDFTSATNCDVYVNGVFKESLAVGSMSAGTGGINVGTYQTASATNPTFNMLGYADEFITFDRNLTQTEITWLYNNELTEPSADLPPDPVAFDITKPEEDAIYVGTEIEIELNYTGNATEFRYIIDGINSTFTPNTTIQLNSSGNKLLIITAENPIGNITQEQVEFIYFYDNTSQEEEQMDGIGLMIGIGIFASILIFVAFKLNEEHFILKLIFLMFSLISLILIPITIINSVDNTALYFLRLIYGFFGLFFIYFSVYVVWYQIKKSERLIGILKR